MSDGELQLRSRSRTSALVVLATLALSAALPLLTLDPPTSDSLGFSSDRALAHLKVIANEPHPHGSPAHLRVREYLVEQLTALGLEVETPESQLVLRNWRTPFRVVNIVARLRGTANTKPVLLAAHYDSRRGSFGAGDDGAAVAALLEVMRVLKNDPPPRNDVILLLTDAEELGLLGAQAIVRDFDWPATVGVLLNFDARGTSGPSIMYETSRGNARLIAHYARHAPHPTASSLSDAVYQLMPNDTDFTILRDPSPLTRPRAWFDRLEHPATQPLDTIPHVPGLNFAFIGSYANYHTPNDNLDNLSLDSMRHQGLNALALARHFSNEDLNQSLHAPHDAIYFDVLNTFVVRFPAYLAVPLSALAGFASIFVVTTGLRRRRLRWHRVLLSFALLLPIPLLAITVTWPLAAWIGDRLDHHPGLAAAGICLLAFACATSLPLLYRRWVATVEISAAVLLAAVSLSLLAAIFLPGGSYLFLLPTLTLCITLATLFARAEDQPLPARAWLTLVIAPVPTLLVLSPMIYLAFLGLRLGVPITPIGYGLRLAAPLAMLPVLALLPLLPQLKLITARCPSRRRPASPPPPQQQ